jgi:hypothetical protein
MELKKRFHENVYYYTNVFEDAKKLIALVEEIDSDPRTYTAITK